MLYTLLFILFLNFMEISPVCIENKNYCSKCNPLTDLCFRCSEEYIFKPDTNGGCEGSQKCFSGKNYCLECDEDEKLCKNCEEGFYPDENGACSFSKNCNISLKGDCLECKSDFILVDKNKMCKPSSNDDFKNCREIEKYSGLCTVCENGYFLNGGDKKCTKTEFCYESMFGICSKCNSNFYLNKKENKCYKKEGIFSLCEQTIDGQKCDKCDSSSYEDEDGICVNTPFCSKSTDQKCNECISGYYLSANNNVCTTTKNCYFGDNDFGICLNCNMYYYLDNKDYKCNSNLEENDFKYCSNVVDNTCVKCESGYYLGRDSKCSFTPNCQESENGKCIVCNERYYLGNDNLCSDVEHCIKSRFNFCRECEDGYYYSPKDKKCIENDGSKSLENCKYSCIDSEETKCCECKNNFYLNNETLCVDNSKNDKFYKCAFVDENGENCIKCIEGYYLGSEDKRCTLIENCKISENENRCSECDDLFCLDRKTGNCVNNDFLHDINKKFYFACKKANNEGTRCEQCLEGYKLNGEGNCVNLSNCEDLQGEKCLKCKNEKSLAGYLYCANEVFGCVEGHFKNCLRCDNLNDLFACTQCEDGFELDQYGACVEKKIN